MINHGGWFYEYHLDFYFDWGVGILVFVFFILSIWHYVMAEENRDE